MKSIIFALMAIMMSFSAAFAAPATKTIPPSAAAITPPKPSYVYGSVVNVPFTNANAAFDTDAYVGTNQLHIPQAGIHLITMRGANYLESSFLALYYSLNGGAPIELCFSLGTGGAYAVCNGSELIQLNTGDTIQFHAYSSSDHINVLRFGISRQ